MRVNLRVKLQLTVKFKPLHMKLVIQIVKVKF